MLNAKIYFLLSVLSQNREWEEDWEVVKKSFSLFFDSVSYYLVYILMNH